MVIPARNESGSLPGTIEALTQKLRLAEIETEILVINDGSSDDTEAVLQSLCLGFPEVRYLNNDSQNGFGLAIRFGLRHFRGDAVAVYMADGSDSPADLVRFYQTMLEQNVDCVFGTRFAPASKIIDYPPLKLILNRLANLFIQVLFQLRYNDVTNAFKLYRRHVIQGLQPLLSHHFNLTVELPLKSIIRGFSYRVLPNDWTNRKAGISKLKIEEMGSRYLFIVLYCWLEKTFSRGDYIQRPERSLSKVPD